MNLSMHEISQCIGSREYGKAEQAISTFILVQGKDGMFLSIPKNDVGQNNVSQQEVTNYAFCDQFVNLITRLFCAPDYRPSQDTIAMFLAGKHIVEWLFSASLWKNTDSLIEHLKLVQLNTLGQVNLNERQLTFLLMLTTLGSKYRLPWGEFYKMSPAMTLTAYIGLITQKVPALTKETSKGFNHLLESAKQLPIFDLPKVEDLAKLNFCFFNCSYATSPDKYEFKKWMTTLIRHNLQQWLDDEIKCYIAAVPAYKYKKKQKIAVMLEKYSHDHAMYRCFNSSLKHLSKEFELIAFIDQSEVEQSDLSIFDKIVSFNSPFDITAKSRLVTQEHPDIIIYPSIGMKFWGVYLSQLRLAPLQMMLAGHPSSSFSPEIDYCLLFRWSTNIEQLQPFFSEKIIMGDIPTDRVGFHTRHSGLTDSFLSEHNHFLVEDEEMIIGINGVMAKVTADIIDICKRIQQGTSKKLTFVFFSQHKSNQLAYLAAKKQISRELKNFELICFSDYISYMKTISQCHFLLPTLPFGGSNSNIDAMVLNKPKLFIRGTAQIYTVCDQWEWERVSLNNELGCNNEDDLVTKSLQLIDDNQYRKNIHELLVEKCSLEKIFPEHGGGGDLLSDVFTKAIEHAVSH